ncbi:MAG TPA: cbb3-type cytochrome c oxidase subunit I [Gemmatimonadales bacterium]|jgi:cytochrome c oxidase subunit 1
MSAAPVAEGVRDGRVLRAALAYLVTGFATFLLMGLLGLHMRLDQGGLMTVSPTWFYRIMTLHGSGMVAGTMLATMGGLAAAVERTVRLSARALWTAFLVYMLGMGFIVLATTLGGFAAGWTVLYPLPALGRVWTLWAAVAAFVGYLFVTLGFTLYCFHIAWRIAAERHGLGNALGWSLWRKTEPNDPRRPGSAVEIIAAVVTLQGVFTGLVGAAYVVPVLLKDAGLVAALDPLLEKNLAYLFGHQLANLNIYFAAAFVYALVAEHTGRRWPASRHVAVAWNLVLLLVLLPWPHHLYQDFAQPTFMPIAAEAISFLVGIPSFLVTIFGALGRINRSGMQWSVPMILVALGLWGWVTGGLGAVLDSVIQVNQVTHNTLWVPAHFHTYYLLGAAAFTWAYLYDLVTRLAGVPEGRASRVAAWLYGVGGAGFVLMFFLSGAAGVPRRYAAHLPQWQPFARMAVPFVVLLALALVWLAVDVVTRLRPAWVRAGAGTRN